MARYRIGDKFLSEEEYNEEIDFKWQFFLFIGGAFFGGVLANELLEMIESPKIIRFLCSIVSGFFVGYVLAKFVKIIQAIFYISCFMAIVGVLLSLIWSLMS